jgi:hypothetical protein
MGLKKWSLSNPGFEPATFRSLVQHANHCANRAHSVFEAIVPDPEPVFEAIVPDPEPVFEAIVPDPEPVFEAIVPDPEPVFEAIIVLTLSLDSV